MNELLSSKNHHLSRLRKLVNQRKTRSAERVFVVEGPVLVAEAFISGVEVRELFVGLESNEDASDFVEAIAAARSDDVPIRFCRSHALVAALDTVSSQPVAAVVAQPEKQMSALETGGAVLVLVDVRDPGNVGTLARTAEASGCDGMIVAGTTTDIWSPKVVRASAGAVLRLPIMVERDTSQVLAELTSKGRAVVATTVSEQVVSYDQSDLRSAAIVVGNEANGLDKAIVAQCSEQVTIELAGPTESLNVATAGAVLCFEALRQRRKVDLG